MKKHLILGVAALALFAGTASAQMVLKRGNGDEPGSLDPHQISGTWESSIAGDQFLGLLTEAADGTAIAGAAESWTISDDGLVYTFTLRDHTWSDGTPVTAGDFAFGMRRILAPETAASYAYLMYIIDGGEAYNGGEAEADTVAVNAIDDKTLEITLASPAPYFLAQLTHNTAYPVPQHVVEEFGDDWSRPENIVVNGAFKVSDWTIGESLTLDKNPMFYDAANVALDQVIFYPIAEETVEYNAWAAGELDTTNSVPLAQQEEIMANHESSLQVTPYGGTYYYSFNTTEAPFDNPDVRNALSMAIDREFITDVVDTSGKIPAYSWVPTSLTGYEAATVPWADVPYEERVDMAIELLEAAGQSDMSVTLRYNTSEGHKAIALAIADQWTELGVEVELFNTDASTHYDDIQQQDFQIARAGWIWDYPDAESMLQLFKEGVPYNYGQYSNAEFEALMAASYEETDPAARNALLQQAEAIAMAEAASAPIYYYNSRHLVSDAVEGWVANGDDRHRSRWITVNR